MKVVGINESAGKGGNTVVIIAKVFDVLNKEELRRKKIHE